MPKKKAGPASKKEHATALRALTAAVAAGARPEHARPVSNFMCFHTDDPDKFQKCYWNPVEQRYNKNCQEATREECQGGA